MLTPLSAIAPLSSRRWPGATTRRGFDPIAVQNGLMLVAQAVALSAGPLPTFYMLIHRLEVRWQVRQAGAGGLCNRLHQAGAAAISLPGEP